jgi:microcin C transport system permease protein
MIPTLVGMTLMLFVIVRFAPGLTTGGSQFMPGMMNSKQAQEEEQRIMEKRLHLVDENGKPISLPMQYVYWLRDTCDGNFGTSIEYNQQVIDLIKERLPVTLLINAISMVVMYIVAIPCGMLAAVRKGGVFDHIYAFGSLALYSLPVIWAGSMLLGFLANPQFLNWFPSAGIHSTNTDKMTYLEYVGDYFWHIALPTLCLTYGSFAYLSNQVRASMLDTMHQDFVRTARAKGLSEPAVLIRHVFRNVLLPLITITGMSLPGLLGGSVIVEQIFSINGMGRLAVDSTFASDLPVMQTIGLVGSILTLLSYLLVDICYCIADPRVTYD